MKSLKTLLGIATDEITDEREKAAILALKNALVRVEQANDALEALKNSIDDGSFVPTSNIYMGGSCSPTIVHYS